MSTAADALRNAGLRRTQARLAVLSFVESLDRPVSHAELQAAGPLGDIDDITLYRNLAVLEAAGLLHRVHGIDGVWRYGANRPGESGCPGNHAHFLCTTCGGMSCLVEQALPRVEVPPGAAVAGRHLVAWGRCAACAGDPTPCHTGDPG